jgi:hypothetical protein
MSAESESLGLPRVQESYPSEARRLNDAELHFLDCIVGLLWGAWEVAERAGAGRRIRQPC